MKDIEEALDRALKGIESILPSVVENFIAVWIAAHRFDLTPSLVCNEQDAQGIILGVECTICTLPKP